MDDIFETLGADDSPMRLHGSSTSSTSVASRLYGTRSRRDSLGSDPELISFSDSDMHDITNQVEYQLMKMEKKWNTIEQMIKKRISYI
uniref:Nonstructural protein 5 n=1 Tax=Heterorhabditis bacteriophora TaxID=37862 RepID=A0A1I7WRQ3_HETBA